jgi:D-alanyl-D-alanine dipeptidase
MWKIVSNPEYVANPPKVRFIIERRTVDITLVDATGKELNMGTSFGMIINIWSKKKINSYQNTYD